MGRDGEFAERNIAELKKRGGLAEIVRRSREQNAEPEIALLFAPVKRGALETIIQKATELGVARLQPVLDGTHGRAKDQH